MLKFFLKWLNLLNEEKDNIVEVNTSESIDKKLEKELEDGGTIDLHKKWQDMKDPVTKRKELMVWLFVHLLKWF